MITDVLLIYPLKLSASRSLGIFLIHWVCDCANKADEKDQHKVPYEGCLAPCGVTGGGDGGGSHSTWDFKHARHVMLLAVTETRGKYCSAHHPCKYSFGETSLNLTVPKTINSDILTTSRRSIYRPEAHATLGIKSGAEVVLHKKGLHTS